MSSVTEPEAIIHGFVDLIRPSLVTIVVDTIFSASLFTLFVVLLALSTRESRRRLVFQLNVFAICFALTMGVLVAFESGKIIVGQTYWLPESTFFLIDDLMPHAASGDPFFRNPNLIAEWTMQIADNTLFLYNLHTRAGSTKWASGMPARIRQIFYISAANFVFPLIFSMILIIFITAIAVTEQLTIVAVMGVLCATIWCSRSEWVRIRNEPLAGIVFLPKLNLGRVHENGMECRNEIVVAGKWSATPNSTDLDAGPMTSSPRLATPTDQERYCMSRHSINDKGLLQGYSLSRQTGLYFEVESKSVPTTVHYGRG
ncbi:hypothetical protein EDC04DRAFT_2600881 [Pisolithus marmoratus]|nr:hypothetical protein EDC04DRAFT_2600881 [Pisolithus marmoratus]